MDAYISSVAQAWAVDPLTLRITTSVPDPMLPIGLRMILIISRAWATTRDGITPASFKDGEAGYVIRHTHGTGPFMLTGFEPSGPIAMVRNADWWGFERYPHNIDRIEYTPIADRERRLAALLDGELDLLTDPPFDALERIESTPVMRLE